MSRGKTIGLLLLVLACLGAGGWGAKVFWDWRQEENAVAAVEKLGGKVERDENRLGRPVVGVNLIQVKVTDADLKTIAAMKSLRKWAFDGTQVTDVGLKELTPLKELQDVAIRNMPVTDKSLQVLVALGLLHGLDEARGEGHRHVTDDASIRFLELRRSQITDAGLKELVGLKSLQRLYLPSQVTDEGLKELAGLKELQVLEIPDTAITDNGLGVLLKLGLLHATYVAREGEIRPNDDASIRSLDLSDTPITDAVLKELAVLKFLQRLNLTKTKVTEAGLEELAVHKGLRELQLPNNNALTDKGLGILLKLGLLHTLERDDGKRLKDDMAIRWLKLNSTKVTGAVKELAMLRELEVLELSDFRITDESLRVLLEIGMLHTLPQARGDEADKRPMSDQAIRSLDLHRSKVTDSGIKALAKLEHLEKLQLGDEVKATSHGYIELRKALPNCYIHR